MLANSDLYQLAQYNNTELEVIFLITETLLRTISSPTFWNEYLTINFVFQKKQLFHIISEYSIIISNKLFI